MYILTVALFVDSKNRTVTRFQTESGMAAIKGTSIAVLSIDTYKIFTVRAILQVCESKRQPAARISRSRSRDVGGISSILLLCASIIMQNTDEVNTCSLKYV